MEKILRKILRVPLESPAPDPVFDPDLDLQFARDLALDHRITFTRASTATFVGSNKLIQSASNNVARFDHDPATGESLGLLIEESRTNHITESEDFSGYSKTQTATFSNEGTAPDGTNNATKLVEAAGSSFHIIKQVSAFSYASGDTYTHSAFLKAGTVSVMQLSLPGGAFGSNGFANFDLANGVLGTVGSSATASIEDFGNGWFRCVITATATATSSEARGTIIFTNNSTTAGRLPTYAGDTANHVFIFGNQLEEASFPTSYIPTSGATATRAVEAAKIETSKFRYSEPQGTFLVEVQTAEFGSDNPYIYSLNDNTSSNRIFQRIEDGATTRYTGVSGNTTRWSIATGSVQTSAAFFKSATAYLVENIFVATDGGNTGSATSAVSPTGLLELDIGSSRSSSTNRLNGHIKQIQYFARRLDDATLIALSQPSLEPSLSLVFDSSETSFVDTELTR